MSLPAGVTTCNVIFNTPLSFAGGTGTATLTVRPTQTIIWAATGQPLGAFSDTVTTSAQPGSMALPVVDQPGFVDSAGNTVTNWAYTADVLWTVGTQNLSTHKSFQLLTGQTSVTFDLIPDGNTTIAVTAPTATVTSVNGATGPITLDSASVGLSNVDNTSDANKPLSTAATNALALKQDAASLDTTNAGLVNDSASATAAALNATYAPVSGSANYAPTAMAEAGPLLVKLERNVSNAVIAVLGDSTGQGDFTTSIRWPLKFANKLAALFPAYTVIFYMWDSTTVAYDAPVTLSTGSGPQTLTIYNCSASGQTTAYSLANLVVATPVKPDLVLINHGHNESLASYQSGALALVRGVRTRYPRTPIVAISQNPQALTDPAYTVQQQIREYIGYFAAREGLGFLDATSIFANISGYSTTLMVDGTHPNDAGYELWADATVARFTPSSKGIVRVPPAPLDVIRINASQFTASGGSPIVAAATVDRPFGGWSLDPAVAASVSTLAYIPPEWESVNVQIYWTVATDPGGNTGAVVWDVYAYAMPATYPAAYGTRHDYGGVTSAVVPSSGAINLLRRDTRPAGSAYEVTERGPFALTIQRFANSGGDTLGINAVFVGVDIERVA